MKGILILCVALIGCGSIHAGEPGAIEAKIQHAFGTAPIPERPETVSVATPGGGGAVDTAEAPKATWGGLFKAVAGFPFRIVAATLRETGNTGAAIVEGTADYSASIGGEIATLEK